MTGRILPVALAAAFAVLFAPNFALAAEDTQVFTVTVPTELTITAPAAVTVTHDKSDANQAFTSQSWSVTSNGAAGGSVTFAVSAPFTHATDTTYKADCKLDLQISSSDASASWTLGTASAQTDYANATPVTAASVSASSSDAGDATFGLAVTFLQNDYSLLAAGNYAVTVTGTVTAN